MTEADKLFNQVFKRWTNRQSFILSFSGDVRSRNQGRERQY